MWRAYKSSGREWPTLDQDEVIDYLILEAVATKAANEETELRKEIEKERELDKWRNDKSALREAVNQ